MADSQTKNQVSLALSFRNFTVPPVGDGLMIGRRAAIGPTALFESVERLLPDAYQLVKLDNHPTVEAVIVLKARARMLGVERLVDLIVANGAELMDATTCLQLGIDGEVLVRLEVER